MLYFYLCVPRLPPLSPSSFFAHLPLSAAFLSFFSFRIPASFPCSYVPLLFSACLPSVLPFFLFPDPHARSQCAWLPDSGASIQRALRWDPPLPSSPHPCDLQCWDNLFGHPMRFASPVCFVGFPGTSRTICFADICLTSHAISFAGHFWLGELPAWPAWPARPAWPRLV